MTIQRRNPELVNLLSADLQPRYEPNFAWGQASGILLASQLRGHWNMASVYATGNVADMSGQVRALTNNNTVTFGVQGICPYATFVKTSTQYLSRTDETGLDITADLTCGGWFYFDNATPAAAEVLIAKAGGDGHRSFWLLRNTDATIRFSTSSDCSAWTNSDSTDTVGDGVWVFLWGRFTANGANSVVDVGINRDYWSQAETNGSICNSDADFTIGASAVPGNYLDGRASLAFLCADDLSDAQLWNIYEQTRAMFGA